MNARSLTFALLAASICLAAAGCDNAPGKPKAELEASRPDQVLDFPTLYKQNCSACHGDNGKNGAAISLANPVYLATAGADNIQRITAAGIPGTLMPPFSKQAGGMLTDAQVAALARGMVATWGQSNVLAGATPLPYASQGKGNAEHGQIAFTTFCASCHGADGAGTKTATSRQGSIVDPAYLALVSDQGLRSIIIAGNPEQHMPDWRSYITGAKARPMTDAEVTDIVAWLASHRTVNPGQPYAPHP